MRVLGSLLLSTFCIAVFATSSRAAVINEIFADDAGTDTNEFIELFGQPGESLDGLSVIVIDNDNGGSTTSSAYRRVNRQFDLITQVIPADGYYVLGGGPDLAGIVDFPFAVGGLQNGSQTYALVRTTDIEYDNTDTDELTQASIDAIAANAIDIIATSDETDGDVFDFGPVIGWPGGVDAASRFPNGIDTDSAGDWTVFDLADAGLEIGDPRAFFVTPGRQNIPEPTSILLVALGLAAAGVNLRRD